jgi:hypothetical protein
MTKGIHSPFQERLAMIEIKRSVQIRRKLFLRTGAEMLKEPAPQASADILGRRNIAKLRGD